jgi:hypothetical protein
VIQVPLPAAQRREVLGPAGGQDGPAAIDLTAQHGEQPGDPLDLVVGHHRCHLGQVDQGIERPAGEVEGMDHDPLRGGLAGGAEGDGAQQRRSSRAPAAEGDQAPARFQIDDHRLL